MSKEKDLIKQVTAIKFEGSSDFIIPNYSGLKERIVTKKLVIDEASDTYFQYNSTTSELELYVNGALIASW